MKHRSSLELRCLLAPAAAAGESQPPDADVVFPQRLSARELLYACNSSALTQMGRERRRYCAGFISGAALTPLARRFSNRPPVIETYTNG